jgi:hypothetical protein
MVWTAAQAGSPADPLRLLLSLISSWDDGCQFFNEKRTDSKNRHSGGRTRAGL